MKDQIKVLKGKIFVKRIQSAAYDKHKDALTDDNCLFMLILPNPIQATRKIKSKALIPEIKASLSSPLAVITRVLKTSFNRKDIAIMTEDSNHKRVTSISTLKNVVGTVEKHSGKKKYRVNCLD